MVLKAITAPEPVVRVALEARPQPSEKLGRAVRRMTADESFEPLRYQAVPVARRKLAAHRVRGSVAACPRRVFRPLRWK